MRFAEAYVRHGKKPTNVSINEGLLNDARSLDINLSATLERALTEEVRRLKIERWREENREAIAAYNAFVEEGDIFSDHFRLF